MTDVARTDKVQAQRWRGVFAVDGDDRDTRAGELSYDPSDGIFVDTLDLFTPDSISDKSAGHPYPALKGIIEGNRQCTVLNGFATKFGGEGGLEESHIVGNEIVLNEFCDDPDATLYRRLRFRSPAFTAFVHPRGIKTEIVRRSKTVKIKAQPKPVTSVQWGDHKLVLSSLLQPPSQKDWDGTCTLSEQPYLDIHYAKPVSLNDIRTHTAALEFLSCIADGDFSGPPELTIWRDPLPSRRSKKPPSLKALGAELLLSQSWYRPAKGKHPLRRAILLDTLGAVPLEFIGRWLDLAPRIERLMTLYQAAAEVPNVETRFLFLIQSIEGMHRALDNREGIDQKIFEAGAAAMTAAIPAGLTIDQHQFFKDRAPRHNELGLGARLGDYGRHVKKILPGALPDFSKDKQNIKKLRDDFSHAFPRTVDPDAETHGRKILYYCELLRLLFEFNLIYHVSEDEAVVADVYNRNGAFDELKRHRADLVSSKPAGAKKAV